MMNYFLGKNCNFAAEKFEEMSKEQPQLGSAVGKLRDMIFQSLRREFAAHESTHLTVDEYVLLYKIHQEKQTIILQDLADQTGKSKSTILHLVDSLESKGVLRRSVNPDDRRENHLIITDEGDRIFDEHYQMEQTLTQQLLRGISSYQVRMFLRIIDRIKGNQPLE